MAIAEPGLRNSFPNSAQCLRCYAGCVDFKKKNIKFDMKKKSGEGERLKKIILSLSKEI
jgi:hypothetical protein